MANRPVLKVDVDDARFKTLAADLDKFNKTVVAQPDLWKGLNAETKKTEVLLMHIASSLLAIADNTKKVAVNDNEISKHVRTTSGLWSSIARDSKSHLENVKATASHIKSIGTDLLRWTGITSVLGSIFGIGGGMFALDRLALSASAGLRSSSGQGISYGQQQAFGLSYGKYVNASGFLGGISQARGNLGSPAYATLRALGVNPGEGNSGEVSTRTMEALYKLAREAPNELELGNIVNGRQLGNIDVDVDTLRRLRRLSPQQFAQTKGQFAERSAAIDVQGGTLDKWQEFLYTLDTAGEKIKSSLIKGLVGLTDPLSKLTDAFSAMVKKVLEGEGFKWIIDKLTDGLRSLSEYIGSPQFKSDLQAIFDFFKYWAQKFGIISSPASSGSAAPIKVTSKADWDRETEQALRADPVGPVAEARYRKRREEGYMEYLKGLGNHTIGSISGGASGQTFLGGIVGSNPINNPGGMRGPGGKGFLQFSSPEAGLKAAYENLRYYEDKEGRKTIDSIIGRWAPPNENNTSAYQAHVKEWSGLGDKNVSMRNADDAARVLSSITRQEGMKFYTPEQIKVILNINENTGGSTHTTINAMGAAQ